jgi:hypothetical protein
VFDLRLHLIALSQHLPQLLPDIEWNALQYRKDEVFAADALVAVVFYNRLPLLLIENSRFFVFLHHYIVKVLILDDVVLLGGWRGWLQARLLQDLLVLWAFLQYFEDIRRVYIVSDHSRRRNRWRAHSLGSRRREVTRNFVS